MRPFSIVDLSKNKQKKPIPRLELESGLKEIADENGLLLKEYNMFCPFCGISLLRKYIGEKENPIKDYYGVLPGEELACPDCIAEYELAYIKNKKESMITGGLKTIEDLKKERDKRLKLSNEKHDQDILIQKMRAQHQNDIENWRKERETLCAEIDKLRRK